MASRPIEPEARPRVGVGVFVVNGDQILLQRRQNAHGAGTWSCPGGHLEFGESLETCATREVAEETGVQVANLRFLCITNDVFAGEGKHYVTIWLAGRHAAGEPRVNAAYEMTDVGWFSWDALPRPLFLSLENLLSGQSSLGDPAVVLERIMAVAEPARVVDERI